MRTPGKTPLTPSRKTGHPLFLTLLLFLLPGAPLLHAEALKDAPSGIRRIEDAAGRRIPVPMPFRRIISLYAAHTENLFALGLTREIIGVGRHHDFPPAASEKPVFSYHDDPEKFLAARPDLVLIRPMIDRGYPRLTDRLERFGIAVVSLQPSEIKDLYDYWRLLGILTGKENEAAQMTQRFQQALAAFERLTRPISDKKTVYFEAIHARMKTFSPTAVAMCVLAAAGGINAAADARPVRGGNIAAYGKERILARADIIDVYLAQQGRMNRADKHTIRTEPGFHIIKAIQKDQIHLVDEAIVSRPTFRLLLGIRDIGLTLYPDLFRENGHSILQRAARGNSALAAAMDITASGGSHERL